MSGNLSRGVARRLLGRFRQSRRHHPRVFLSDSSLVVFVCGVSRSGTTLLAAILDSHSQITMGYELVPPPIGDGSGPGTRLGEALGAPDLKSAAALLGDGTDAELGKWLRRCGRVGATPADVHAALAAVTQYGSVGAQKMDGRLALAAAVIGRVQERAGTAMSGFKLTGEFELARALFPQGRFAYILRDPRDVLASQITRGYGRSPAAVADSWLATLHGFERLRAGAPEVTALIRYEDLVRDPERAAQHVFSILPLDFEDQVLDLQHSEATILRTGHPSAQQVSRGFFTDSIGRGVTDLPNEQRQVIEERCHEAMERHGYAPVRRGGAALRRLTKTQIAAKQAAFARRRVFSRDDYERLLAPYRDEHESMRLVDYIRDPDIGDRRILLIRHDIDHDHLTAVRIAEWEARAGLRTTYCLLHTAWYYGDLRGNGYEHTRDVLDCAHRLLELGHEVSFHNNLVTLALQNPEVDPRAVLENELEFFRGHGVPIVGTTGHGDALCRQLQYRNWELFIECPDHRFGGPRTVMHSHEGRSARVTLREVSMTDLGLEYEGYDIHRDVYHTESGGRMRTRQNLRGRRPFGRPDLDRGEVIGVLTHPIWWDFPK